MGLIKGDTMNQEKIFIYGARRAGKTANHKELFFKYLDETKGNHAVITLDELKRLGDLEQQLLASKQENEELGAQLNACHSDGIKLIQENEKMREVIQEAIDFFKETVAEKSSIDETEWIQIFTQALSQKEER